MTANNSTFVSAEASLRLSDHWSLEMEGRLFTNTHNEDVTYQFRKEDYLQLELRRNF